MTARLSDIQVETASAVAPDPNIEQEQRVAIFDLLEDNRFALPEGPEGPYRLRLAMQGGKMAFCLSTEAGAPAAEFQLALGPLRQIVKDYFRICGGYYEAVKSQPPAQIEALDEARRGIHMEGARVLRERLQGKAEVDEETSRRLFTLLCALSQEG